MVLAFVNQIDTYAGRVIGRVLSESIVGTTSNESQDEDDTARDGAQPSNGRAGKLLYEVVGTVEDPSRSKPVWAKGISQPQSREQLLKFLLSCDVIVYYIGESESQVEEASWAMQALHDQISTFTGQKVFILISTILTWARSKPLNADEPDVPLTEEDYRRRRPHPHFKDHIAAEKLLIKLGKTNTSKFQSFVVACGLPYGEGENIFHLLFKSAWLGVEPHLKIFGDGQNVVPTIHVRDLASVVVSVADSKPKTKYIVAVDDSHSTLEEIVKAISKNLGTGKVQRIPKEEALTIEELSQCHFDQLLVNLQVEAAFIKDSMKIEWNAETGLVENISSVIKEFKSTRDLLPIRVCVLGPPASGKSTVVKKLCQHYKLHHIKVADVIKEAIGRKERMAARADEDDVDQDDTMAQQAKDHLEVLKDDLEENKGRYSDEHLIEFFREKLKSMPCQNQGFVLDGFPKTELQAKDLFGKDDNAEEEEAEAGSHRMYNKLLMPDLIVCLDASNTFLKERVMNLPQSAVAGTHNTEGGLLRRLKSYRDLNEDDVTVLNYFDELEIHPVHIQIDHDHSPDMQQTVNRIMEMIGEARNYGPTSEEKAEMEHLAQENRKHQEEVDRVEQERQEALERKLRAQREAEWQLGTPDLKLKPELSTQEHLVQVQQEEQEMLEVQSTPLRNYLMRHVMPTLTQGLIQVCKVRPEDPVDYLAEYLFKANPQID